MIRLKADLHTHSRDDCVDRVCYSTEQLIDIAAGLGYQALAITGHKRLIFHRSTAKYARDRGVLLVPGGKLDVEGRHVLVLNPDREQASATTFAELRACGRRDAAIIAPPPLSPAAPRVGKEIGREH